MKKVSLLLSCAAVLTAVSLFTGCASTKTPRSIKVNVNKIENIKTAQAIAENYSLNVLIDTKNGSDYYLKTEQLRSKDIFIATDDKKEETVVYVRLAAPGNEEFLFAYVNLNSNATSAMKLFMDSGTIKLNNTDKYCDFESGNYYLSSDAYGPLTKELADLRSALKHTLSKKFELNFTDVINAEQQALTGFKN